MGPEILVLVIYVGIAFICTSAIFGYDSYMESVNKRGIDSDSMFFDMMAIWLWPLSLILLLLFALVKMSASIFKYVFKFMFENICIFK